eukprot:GEMP01006862.1.p1 GENE.GEMP01006862.1~~GEMP01006862.1.p1  ORF type:complete len:986 (-),score=263.97 GEMP01006862.1:661-3618(-)
MEGSSLLKGDEYCQVLAGFLKAHDGHVVNAANAYLDFREKRKEAVIDLLSSDDEVATTKTAEPSLPSAPSAPSAPPPPVVTADAHNSTITRGFCVPIGSAEVMGYSTTSIPRNRFFRVQGTMGPALQGDCPCEIDFTITGLRPKERRLYKLDYGDSDRTNLRRLPPDKVPSHTLLRFSIDGVGEIGTIPAPVARLLVPLLLYDMIDAHCRLATTALPDELQMGTDVPLVIYIALTNHAFSSPASATSGKEDILRASYAGLFELLAIPRLRGEPVLLPDTSDATAAAPCVMEIASDSKGCADDIDEDAITPEDVGALASVGSFEHSYLPRLTPPNTRFVLREYQKQAVYFMWRRENPGKEPPQALCDALPALNWEGDDGEQLHPQWEERGVAVEEGCVVEGVGLVRSFYYHPGAGKLSLSFPEITDTCRGGILADEMGLGKTVMTLALISLDYAPNVESVRTAACVPRHFSESPAKVAKTDDLGLLRPAGTLIVAPISLLHQWQNEWHKYIGGDVFQYYGAQRPKDPGALRRYELVLTTYGTLQAESNGVLSKVFWRRIILDEAHMIKGRTTQVATRVNDLQAWSRWCITGTPMQNSIDELFPLVHFLHAEPYSIYQIWRRVISTPLADGKEEETMKALHGIMKPLLLRRTKDTKDEVGKPIISLPPRETVIKWIDLTIDERDRYDHIYRVSRDKAYALMAHGGSSYTHILQLILKLRMLLCHPSLARSIMTTTAVEGSAEEQKQVLDRVAQSEISECPVCKEPPTDPVVTPCAHVFCLECAYLAMRRFKGMCPLCRAENSLKVPFRRLEGAKSEDKFTPSTKMSTVLEMIEEDMSQGRKVLVFSQWTCFLNLLEKMFSEEDIPQRRLDGTQNMDQRRAAASWLEEHKGGGVLLISLRAGGVGLNLISATKVYLMDLWWNPAVEEQAMQRIHRIGQTKPVTCIKLVVRDSMDEKVLKLQSKKLHLVEGAMQMNARMTMGDLKDLWL